MHIRPLQDSDIAAVAQLLKVLSEEFIIKDCQREAASTFLRENDEAGVRGFVAQGHVYHVAIVDDALAGFVAVRERKHLFHLFVARQLHGQGIARRLWAVAQRAALDAGGDGVFTVNSSNVAVGFYESLGFVRTAPTQCKNGIYFNPMILPASVSPFIGAA